MTTTTATERVSVTAILADLILVQSRAGLPMPTNLGANVETAFVTVRLSSLAEVRAWAVALKAGEPHSSKNSTGGSIHASDVHRSGWFVYIVAYRDDMPEAALDAETLAELEQVAAVQS